MEDLSKSKSKKRRTSRSDKFVEKFNYNYPTKYLLYAIFIPLVKRFIQPILWRVKIEGLDNIPSKSNLILMPNHVSHMDSIFAIVNLGYKGPIHAIADEKLFKLKFFRLLAQYANVFPVRKGAKSIDVVEHAINRIKKGDSMLWYPEGQRHKNPSDNSCNPGKIGSGMVAHAVNAPVIPIFLAGVEFTMPVGRGITWGKGPRSIKLLVRYGKPVPLEDLRKLPASPSTSKLVIDRIMDHIEELRPKGPYRDQSHR